jgi:anti-sigma regulatory factor (Ser/Thr protein kinase)
MEDLALHLLDLAQNAADAGATRIDVRVDEDAVTDLLSIVASDNGRGMNADGVRHATEPFWTTRESGKGGLGLALLQRAAEDAGGGLTIASHPGEGTTVTATFRLTDIDRAPLGDLETTVLVLLASHPNLDVEWTHRRAGLEYTLATSDLRAALDGAPLASPEGIALARRAVRTGETALAAPGRPTGAGEDLR